MATATTKRKSSTKPKTTGRVALAKMEANAAQRVRKGWTSWAGGSCPIDPEYTVMVLFRSGRPRSEIAAAGHWDWSHTGKDGDIIAYRVMSKPELVASQRDGYLHLPKHGLTATETAAAERHGEAADAAEGSALVMRDVASSAEALTKAMHGLRSVVESAPRFDARSFAIGLTCGSGTVFLGLLLGRVLDAVL